MEFHKTEDGVLYLYPYYSLREKDDEKSREVYQVFKKDWDTYFTGLCRDLCEAVEKHFDEDSRSWLTIAVTVMPSHLKGRYGKKLTAMAKALAGRFGFKDACGLIVRTRDKEKSTQGGARDVTAHLETLGLAGAVDRDVDVYIVLDDITTSGSSLEAAKRLLAAGGAEPGGVVKMAVAKAAHDEGYYA